MAKAHKPPAATYQRKFRITSHAIERFRERVDEEFKSLGDAAAGNLLDERIRFGSEERYIDHSNEGRYAAETSIAYKLENRNGSSCYAIVRDNVVMTVLSPEMVDANRRSGLWTDAPDPLDGREVGVTPAMSRPLLTAEDAVTAAGTVAVTVAMPLPQSTPSAVAIREAGARYAMAMRAEREAMRAEREAIAARDAAGIEVEAAERALHELVDAVGPTS
jgi:hypothetical protein